MRDLGPTSKKKVRSTRVISTLALRTRAVCQDGYCFVANLKDDLKYKPTTIFGTIYCLPGWQPEAEGLQAKLLTQFIRE